MFSSVASYVLTGIHVCVCDGRRGTRERKHLEREGGRG